MNVFERNGDVVLSDIKRFALILIASNTTRYFLRDLITLNTGYFIGVYCGFSALIVLVFRRKGETPYSIPIFLIFGLGLALIRGGDFIPFWDSYLLGFLLGMFLVMFLVLLTFALDVRLSK